MKAETKAKRRATLSICGLGMPDESEVGSMRGARIVSADDAHSQQQPRSDTVIDAEAVYETEVDKLVQQFRDADKFGRLKMFQEIKAKLVQVCGDDIFYYDVLKEEAGVEKSDQIKSLGKGVAAFRRMLVAYQKMTEAPSDESAGDQDVPF
jgi:hypothetical protein